MLWILINSLLILITVTLSIKLLFRLLTWSRQFEKWKKDFIKQNSEQLKETNHRKTNKIKIPNFSLFSLVKREQLDFYSLIHSDTVLIFLDQGCVHCSFSFEEFINLNDNLSTPRNFIVVYRQEDIKKAEELLGLYGDKINIYIVDKQVFQLFQLYFMPAFIKVSKEYVVENSTPVPLQVINSF
ncbi:hypothetical protein ABEW00_03210 [Rossellomorea vietnamensis]|uniref:hypothetical protein n=1 Tax=Rossellomorea vietnamensis TaxID=218284 RepID=UPI003D2BF432